MLSIVCNITSRGHYYLPDRGRLSEPYQSYKKICTNLYYKRKIEEDKTLEEVAEAIKELQRKYEDNYALYLGTSMLRYKYRDFILAPYNFR